MNGAAMTTGADIATGGGATGGAALWRRQIGGIVRLELGKVLFSRRALIGWGLAAAPVVLLGTRLLAYVLFSTWGDTFDAPSLIGEENVFAQVYQTLILRLCLYFGCAATFLGLIRGEVNDRALHYYLLAPLKREVLIAGKFVGGLVGAFTLFGLSTFFTRLLMLAYVPTDAPRALLSAPWLPNTLLYLGITFLACLGYGAVFLAVGVARVNPIIPTLVLFGLESVNIFLPSVLKQLSVTYYLTSLCPIPLDLGPIAILASPVPAPVAILGLVALAGALLAWSMRRARWLEVDYGEE
jgi:ABC-type transport system involved in multi-copper enzyme maturation permease subunit